MMNERQKLFMAWLAMRNYEEALRRGQGERMFRWLKQVRLSLGWRFSRRTDAAMQEELRAWVDGIAPDDGVRF
jgi:hypothetical protein